MTSAPPLTPLDSVTTSSTAQATYYDNVGAGAISESLTWGGTAEQTAAVAAVFSWTAAGPITLRNKSNTQLNTANSLAAAKPAGTVEGDLLIATVSHDIGTGTLGAPGAPDDWTLIEPATPGSEQMRTRSWYRVAGASEPSTYTFTSTAITDPMIVQISSYYSSSGVNAAGWTLVDKSYKYQTSLNTISTTSVTATTANLFYAAFINDDNESVTSAPPLSPLTKSVPVIVTAVPPVSVPLVGAMEVTVGVGGAPAVASHKV